MGTHPGICTRRLVSVRVIKWEAVSGEMALLGKRVAHEQEKLSSDPSTHRDRW